MEPSLITYLQESIISYEQLLDLMEEKKQALINNDSEKVQSLSIKEQTLLKVISEQEGSVIEALGNEKVITIIDKMPDGHKKLEAEKMLDKVEHLLTDIAERNEIIKVLLKDALQFSQFTRTQLTQQTQINYGNPNKKAKDMVQKQGFFDTKA